MKKTSIHNLGFTLIEISIVITIIAIISTASTTIWKSYMKSAKIDREVAYIQKTGTILASILEQEGDFPYNNYCKNTAWWYDNNCIQSNSWWSLCVWTYGDMWNTDCDKWCIITNCRNGWCVGNKVFLDIPRFISTYTTDDTNFQDFQNQFTIKLCPSKQTDWNDTKWKANFSENATFNPSFTLYHNGMIIYEYNSNP